MHGNAQPPYCDMFYASCNGYGYGPQRGHFAMRLEQAETCSNGMFEQSLLWQHLQLMAWRSTSMLDLVIDWHSLASIDFRLLLDTGSDIHIS